MSPTQSPRGRQPAGRIAPEIQPYNAYVPASLALAGTVRRQSGENLNQILADTLTLRDLYKKHHWQVSGPTFYALHLMFDRHAGEQADLVDRVAERVMTLGGVAVAMAADVAETTLIPRPPRGRERASAQVARLLHAHEVVLEEARTMARLAADGRDDGTNDLIVGSVIRTNEAQAWFLAQHLIDVPPGETIGTLAEPASLGAIGTAVDPSR